MSGTYEKRPHQSVIRKIGHNMYKSFCDFIQNVIEDPTGIFLVFRTFLENKDVADCPIRKLPTRNNASGGP